MYGKKTETEILKTMKHTHNIKAVLYVTVHCGCAEGNRQQAGLFGQYSEVWPQPKTISVMLMVGGEYRTNS